MKKIFLFFLLTSILKTHYGQNVGIGTSTPQFKLDVNGRMRIMSGGGINTAGLWLNNNANDATPAFIGMRSDTVVGFFGNNSSWKLLMNTNTGNLSLGDFNGNRPLSFPATLEKKISLYPGTTGDAGFGIFGNELRINSDNVNADITLGFDNYQNGFTERMRMKGNGNVGIGTTQPTARLHVADSSVVFTGSVLQPPATTTINPPVQGAGTRTMWFPALGAFRTGYVDGTQWDRNNIGRLSFASGFNNVASGEYAVAMGVLNNATGLNSVCLGKQNSAIGTSAICIGTNNIVGNFAFAIGTGNQAGNPGAVALGEATAAVGNYSFTAGVVTSAYAYGGTSIGSYNDNTDTPDPQTPVSTDRIFQIGNGDFFINSNAMTVLRNGNVGVGTTTPNFPVSFPNTLGDKISLWGNSGPHYGFGVQGSLMQIHSATTSDDIAFGYGSSSSLTERARIINNGEFGMSLTGRLQLKTGTQSAGLWFTNNANTTNTAFAGMRSDTEVGFFGQTGTPGWRFYVNTSNGNAVLQGTLTQNSDATLKTNITSIYNALPQLMKLSGYRYNWKDTHADPEKQIGLLAQEVQAVFPELVKENSNGKLGVNYNGMIPVLLEGIKELNKKIEDLQQQIQLLKNK